MEATTLWADFESMGAVLSDDEKWGMVRDFRSRALFHCDWTMLKDAPVGNRDGEWRVYRQTLRDIPEMYATPNEVIFPTPPEGEIV
jgi:hypothetical protein